MADMSVFTNLIFSWLTTPFIWVFIVFIICGVTWVFLVVRKKRKMIYDCIELVDLGEQLGINTFKCGYVGRKKHLFGWWDSGDEVLQTDTGERIEQFSTRFFKQINGHKGVVCFRHPERQEILIPVDKVKMDEKYKTLIASIASADYSNTAVDIIKETELETSDWTKNVMEWALLGGTIIFALVAIILVTQMVKHGQTEASELIKSAGDTCLSGAKEVCSQIASLASKAP